MVPRPVIVTVELLIFQGLGGVTRSLPGIPNRLWDSECKGMVRKASLGPGQYNESLRRGSERGECKG